MYLAGELELEFTPQGTLPRSCAPAVAASRRSSPAPASARSVAEGKETREFDGHVYVMERSLVPEVSLVKA
jgi:3-oxoacid CoA-transferase subunit A